MPLLNLFPKRIPFKNPGWSGLIARAGGVILFLCLVGQPGCGTSGSDVERCLEEESCGPVIDVLKISGEAPMDPDAPFWNSPDGPKKVEVELGPQMITNPKWPDPSIKKVRVSAAMNGSEIAIHLEWEDSSRDSKYGHSALYADQAAVMFPLEPKAEGPPITMGAEGERVNVWLWKATWESKLKSRKDPASPRIKRLSSVEDLNAEGFSTLTIQEHQDIRGKGVWDQRVWRVVFKRSLTNAHALDVQFRQSTLMAIAVWNGANRETNGQKGIAGWLLLRLG